MSEYLWRFDINRTELYSWQSLELFRSISCLATGIPPHIKTFPHGSVFVTEYIQVDKQSTNATFFRWHANLFKPEGEANVIPFMESEVSPSPTCAFSKSSVCLGTS